MKKTCRRVRFATSEGGNDGVDSHVDILSYLTELLCELPKLEVLYDSVVCVTKNESTSSSDQQSWPVDFPYAARYQKKRIIFKTRWHGWPPAFDSWEPYDNFNEEIFRDMLITLAIKLYFASTALVEQVALHSCHVAVRDLVRRFPTDERLIRSVVNHSLTIQRSSQKLTRDKQILSMTEPPPILGRYWFREYAPEYRNIGFSHFRLPRPIPPISHLTPSTAFSRFATPSAFKITLPLTYRRLLPPDLIKSPKDFLSSTTPESTTPEPPQSGSRSTDPDFSEQAKCITLYGLLTHGAQFSILNDVNAKEVFNFLYEPPTMTKHLQWHSGTLLPPYSTYVSLVPQKITVVTEMNNQLIALTHFKPYYGSGQHTPAWITLDHLNDKYPFLIVNYFVDESIDKVIGESQISFDVLLTSRIFESDLIAELYESGGSPELSRVNLEWTTKDSAEDWALLSVRGCLRDCYLSLLTLMSILESAECILPGGAQAIHGSDCRVAIFLPFTDNIDTNLNLVEELENLTTVCYPPFRTHPAHVEGFEPEDEEMMRMYSSDQFRALTTPLLIFDRPTRCAHAIKLVLENLVRSHLEHTSVPELQLAEWYADRFYNRSNYHDDRLSSGDAPIHQLPETDVQKSYRQVVSIPAPQLPRSSSQFREIVQYEQRLWTKFVDFNHPYLTQGPPPSLEAESAAGSPVRKGVCFTDDDDDDTQSELFDMPCITFNEYQNKLGREKAFELMQTYGRLAYGFPAAISPNDQSCQSCMTVDRWGNLTIGTNLASGGSRGYYIGPQKDSDDVPGHLTLITNEK